MSVEAKIYASNNKLQTFDEFDVPALDEGCYYEFNECYYFNDSFYRVDCTYVLPVSVKSSVYYQSKLAARKLLFLNMGNSEFISNGYEICFEYVCHLFVGMAGHVEEISRGVTAAISEYNDNRGFTYAQVGVRKHLLWKVGYRGLSKDEKNKVVGRVISFVFSGDIRRKAKEQLSVMLEVGDTFISTASLQRLVATNFKDKNVPISLIHSVLKERELEVDEFNKNVFGVDDGRSYRVVLNIDNAVAAMIKLNESNKKITKSLVAETCEPKLSRKTIITNWKKIITSYNEITQLQ